MVDPETTSATGTPTPLGLALRSIGSYELLTGARERETARRAREGSREARDRLVGAQLRAVLRLAREHKAPGLSLLDLIAEGTVGVEKAVNRYDERRDGPFAPLALRGARREIERAVRAAGGRPRRRVDARPVATGDQIGI